MRKILITGGAGFIGSHITEQVCRDYPDAQVVVLDKMTYAADIHYILDLLTNDRIELVVADICDYEVCLQQIQGCDLVIHAAAESHVDRSFHSSILFTRTNTLGTHTVLEAARIAKVPRIIHISTDEVYGEVIEGERDERGELNPTNPYSASKAAAEMIVTGYRHSFRLPIITVRANNIFGIRQYPEKLIPRSILSILQDKKVPLHGDGHNVRHFLSARDFAEAVVLLARSGKLNEVYNIGSPDELSNRQVVAMVCQELGRDFDSSVRFVEDRPFNDRRYAISWDKITDLGWKPSRKLSLELPEIVNWYRRNLNHIVRKLSELTDDTFRSKEQSVPRAKAKHTLADSPATSR